jgi:hypothetical protein
MIARRAALTLTFALASIPTAAWAQPSDADRATARVLAEQGHEALDKKDYATAADRFGRARQMFPAPTLSLGLAQAQVGLGQWVAAQELLNRILREGAPPGSPPAWAKALVTARKELDALAPRIPSVIINVKGAPSSRVTIDGVPLPSAGLGVNRVVDPGRHAIHAEADGFTAADAAVTVAEGRVETVTLTLQPGPAAPHASPPVAPPPAAPLPATQSPPAQPPASGGSLAKTLGFVGIGVGGAGILMGAIAGGIAVVKHGSLATACPQSQCIGQQSAIDSYQLTGTITTAGFVAGGVLAATGVVLVLTAPKARPAGEARIAPFVGAGFAGAEGRF